MPMIIIQCFSNKFLELVFSRIIQEATPLHLDRQINALQTLTDLSSFVSTCVCVDLFPVPLHNRKLCNSYTVQHNQGGDPKTLTPGPWTPIRTGSTDYYTDRSTDYPDGPPPRTPPKTT